MNTSPLLSVIIPTRDRFGVLDLTLKALTVSLKDISAEIIIVNDGNDLPESIKSESIIKIIPNRKTGVAAGRNTGAAASAGKILLFLDDDMILSPPAIRRIIQLADEFPKRVIVPAWTYPPQLYALLPKTAFGRYLLHYQYDSLKGWKKGEYWNEKEPFLCKTVASCCLPLSRNEFENVQGYDEEFPHAGFEDQDFCDRLQKKGLELYIDPLNVVFHNESDRIQARHWLLRKRRAAETRRVAFNKGYKVAELKFSPARNILYSITAPFYPVFVYGLKLIPNFKFFDSLYFKGVNFLLGLNSFVGFRK